MIDPGQHDNVLKRLQRSEFMRCLGYAALAEVIIGMAGIGGLLDARYVSGRTKYKQDAHELLMSGVELFFVPADWTARTLDSGSNGLLYGGMRLMLALAAPTIVWGAGLFILRYSSRVLDETINRFRATSQVDNSSSSD